RAHEKGEGLPGYLGIRLTETWPGGMRAEIPVRDELLNPFGNLHGGVLASLCDHVLGTVCYPVIPPGAWAATTEFKRNYLAAVAQARRDLPPGGAVPEDYVFRGIGGDGAPTDMRLSDAFAPGRDSLAIYSMMFPRDRRDDRHGPEGGQTARLPLDEGPCPSCT